MNYIDDDLDPMVEELRAQDRHERRQFWAHMAHSDCRDPDHPGCDHCEESDDDSDE